MGKAFFLYLGIWSFARGSWTVALLIGGCSVAADLVHERPISFLGENSRWVGPVSAQDPSCRTGETGVLVARGDAIVFDPFQSTLTLSGTIRGDGALRAALTRPASGNQPNLAAVFDGRLTRDSSGELQITGTLRSGRCVWAVALKRG